MPANTNHVFPGHLKNDVAERFPTMMRLDVNKATTVAFFV